MTYEHDEHGRLVARYWYDTTIGRWLITAGWVLLLGLCVAWACDVMPVNCPTSACDRAKGATSEVLR